MTSLPDLPPGYHARHVLTEDVDTLYHLVSDLQRRIRGTAGVDEGAVRSSAIGIGSWTRYQCVVTDSGGTTAGWATAHDRAGGRTDLVLHLDRDIDGVDDVALALLDWLETTAVTIARNRALPSTRLEMLVDAEDTQLQRWLLQHGHHRARTWLNMSRPVDPDEQIPGRDGVGVRRVRTHDLGDGTTMPVAGDLQAVHLVLERSFADHFNSYRESFGEFVQRLREDPGHRWDHWWLATVEVDGEELIGGALVSTVTTKDDGGTRGSYIDYIGVDRRARGRGVAKVLLATVINDAAERGRNRVSLEVDADSPTGAHGLYSSLGWRTGYVTQSWHKDLAI